MNLKNLCKVTGGHRYCATGDCMGEPENKWNSDILYDFKKESIILLCYGDVYRVSFDVLAALGNPGRAPVVISIMQRAMA